VSIAFGMIKQLPISQETVPFNFFLIQEVKPRKKVVVGIYYSKIEE